MIGSRLRLAASFAHRRVILQKHVICQAGMTRGAFPAALVVVAVVRADDSRWGQNRTFAQGALRGESSPEVLVAIEFTVHLVNCAGIGPYPAVATLEALLMVLVKLILLRCHV